MVGRVSRVSRFALLVSKFRGCLVAAASDGNRTGVPTDIVRCVGQSLVRSRGFDGDDMATGFHSTASMEDHHPRLEVDPNDGCTSSVASAATGRHDQPVVPVDRSTAAVFCGIPVAMYFYGDQSRAVEVTLASADVTIRHHSKQPSSQTSETVYAGAVLHCLALQLAFQFDPVRPLDVELFLDGLVSNVERSSIDRQSSSRPVTVNYDRSSSLRRLEYVRQILRSVDHKPPTWSEAVASLDGDVVSTAIYAFLHGQLHRRVNDANDVLIERVVQQTSSTPFLASLACALTGAYLGIESVPTSMRRRCDGIDDTTKLADNLALQYETQPSVYDRPEIGSLSRRQ